MEQENRHNPVFRAAVTLSAYDTLSQLAGGVPSRKSLYFYEYINKGSVGAVVVNARQKAMLDAWVPGVRRVMLVRLAQGVAEIGPLVLAKNDIIAQLNEGSRTLGEVVACVAEFGCKMGATKETYFSEAKCAKCETGDKNMTADERASCYEGVFHFVSSGLQG